MRYFNTHLNATSSKLVTVILVAAMFGAPSSMANVVVDDPIVPPAGGIILEQSRNSAEAPFEVAFSEGTTAQIVRRLNDAENECGQLPAEYRADCLQQGLRSAAGPTVNKPDYTTAATQLNSASRSIANLVTQNADPAAQPLRKGGKTFRAVKKSAVANVNAKAAAIVAETETKLIRSAGSGLRHTHYARIAQAVGSTKRILRS